MQKQAILLMSSLCMLQACSTGTEDDSSSGSGSGNNVTPEISLRADNISESRDTANITVNLSRAANQAVTGTFATVVGSSTATEDIDFKLSSTTFTIPKGQRKVEYYFSIIGDEIDEFDENITLELSGVTNATVESSENRASITILDDDPFPNVSFEERTSNVAESVGNYDMIFRLDRQSVVPIDVAFEMSGTANRDEDYVAPIEMIVSFDAMETESSISIPIIEDKVREGGETIIFKPIAGANYDFEAGLTHTLVINGDLTLNDTDVTTYSDGINHDLGAAVAGFPGQDAEFGLDSVATNEVDGSAGFSFTKLDISGNELPLNATSWSCVRDNSTGLIWEVKNPDFDLNELVILLEEDRELAHTSNYRAANYEYTFYTEDSENNGRSSGAPNDRMEGSLTFDPAGYCAYRKEEDLTRGYKLRCNTDIYTKETNWYGHCGSKQWRLPTINELRTIVSYDPRNIDNGALHIDQNFFPRTKSDSYYSSTPSAEFDASVWCVDMTDGETELCHKGILHPVRLVTEAE